MKEILGENIEFYISGEITNKGAEKYRGKKKTYDNVLVIRDPEFNNFLDQIEGREEIEEIKFKLKRNVGKGLKRFQSYKIKLNKNSNNFIGQFIIHNTNYNNIKFSSSPISFENPFHNRKIFSK
jgi:hypothetical protein